MEKYQVVKFVDDEGKKMKYDIKKDKNELIDAIKIINTKYNRKDIHLLVAGDGPLYNKCNQMNVNNVHLLGKLDFDNVIKMLLQSKIFCLPTRSEGFTTVGLEASITNNYIISTPVGGIVELLINDSYGTILSKSPTPDEIAEAIILLLIF